MVQFDKKDFQGQLRVALIGYGLAGRVFHAPLISCTRGLKLVAVVTSNRERKAAAEADFPGIQLFDGADELFAGRNEVDLVVIASPNKTHAPLAMAAMDHGLAVVIDKPIATSVIECENLIKKSEQLRVPLTVFQNRRWDGDYLTVVDLIRRGELGAVTRFESRFERWRPQPRAGSWREQGTIDDAAGLLFDLGSHLIDQALTLFGAPRSVYAETAVRRVGVVADDDSFVALSFDNGVLAHLWMSAVARKLGPRFRVLGSQGAFEKFGLDPQEDDLRAGKRPDEAVDWGVDAETNYGTLWNERVDGEKVATIAGNYPAFYAQLREALLGSAGARATRSTAAALPVDPRQALLTMQVITAARESSAKGKVVQIATPTYSI